MKKASFIIVLMAFCATLSFAGKYEEAMEAALQSLNKTNSEQGYAETAAVFERIANAEKDHWLPYYYASLGYIFASHQTKVGAIIDSYLDKAQAMLDQSKNLSAANDEIVTLQGYIYMMKLVVDPATRGQEYGGLAMQEFSKAVAMNVNNPRALALSARMQMGTDQFFGNDLSEACGKINKAAAMFENQNPKSALDPTWGKEMTVMFVKECEEK